MKNLQKGFVGIILVVLIALAAIGGGAYVYTHKESKEELVVQNTEKKDSPQVENKVEPKETNPAPVEPTPPIVVKTTVKADIKPITPVASNTRCGSILDSHMIFEGDKRTSAEISSLGCLSTAILSCTSASLNVTGEDKGTIQVYSKSGQNCVIGSTIGVNGENKKCDVPISLIADLKDYSVKEKEPIENLIVPVLFAMAFGEVNDTRTGATIKVNCQTY